MSANGSTDETGVMARRGIAAFAVVGAAVLLAVAGCSSSSSSSSAASATPTASLSPTAVWAGSVCTGVANLRTAVQGLNDGLRIDVSSDSSALDQAKSQVQAKLATVSSSAEALATAATTPPPGASSALSSAQQNVQTQVDVTKGALDTARTAASSVSSATTPAQFLSAAGRTLVPMGIVAIDVNRLAGSLKDYATSTQADVKDAFATAPTCQSLTQ